MRRLCCGMKQLLGDCPMGSQGYAAPWVKQCDISGNLHRFESLILGRKGSTKIRPFLQEKKLVLFFDQHYSSYTVCSSLASVKLWPQFNIFYHTSSFWQKGSKAFPNFVIILKLENSSEFTLLWPQKNTIINWLLFVVQFFFFFFGKRAVAFFCV